MGTVPTPRRKPQHLTLALLVGHELLTASEAAQAWAPGQGLRSPKILIPAEGPDLFQEPRDAKQHGYLVDDAWLKTKMSSAVESSGLASRRSPEMAHWSGGFAPWGLKVNGLEEGEREQNLYGHLPKDFKGTRGLDPVVEDAIVNSVSSRTWWGFPSYVRYLDVGLESWNELARLRGHLGNSCSVHNALRRCGTALICREGMCNECEMSRDCPDKYLCQQFPQSGRHMCVRRDLAEQWTWREALLTVLVMITAMLSAAAGMGGGGVYVPLLLLLLEFSTQEAVPLSQAMIVGGATVNIIMFAGDRHPKYPRRPKIDYDVVMMLNPGLAAGVTVGVMVNVISPQWIIVLVLNVTLVLALQKSLTKGLSQFRKETQLLQQRQADEDERGEGSSRSPPDGKKAAKSVKLVDFGSFLTLAADNLTQLGLIVGCWVVFLAGNMMKAEQCSLLYWLQLTGLMLICCCFTAAGAHTVLKQASQTGPEADDMLAWTPTNLWMYPLLSTTAGFLGGFLGIGGGIIMGPLLLELGLAAEASQATTSVFVFLSSSLATIQFMVMGKAMHQYALWFTLWVAISTFLGQTIVDYILRAWKRTSLIVLSVAAIIAGSLVMMTAIGAKDTVTDIMRGANMGFTPVRLCER